MKQIGIYPTKREDMTISERLHLIRQVGFDYICAASISQLTDKAFIAGADRESLPIDNVHLTGKNTTAIWFDGEDGNEVVARYQKEMDIALEHGVSMGVMHVTWGFTPVEYAPIGMERLRRLVDHAEKIGFTVCIENSAYPELFHVASELFASPFVRFTFDSGHFNAFWDHNDTIYQRHVNKLAITHLADNEGIRDLHLIPFDGCTDFTAIAPYLKQIDRLTFEVAAAPVKKAHKTTKEAAEADMRRTAAWELGLIRVDNENIYAYENFTYEQFLCRVMESAKRLEKLIEQA